MGKSSSSLKRLREKLHKDSKDKNNRKEDKNIVNNAPVFTREDAKLIAKALKIDFLLEKFDLDQFEMGINVELEHGNKYPETNVTKNDPILTGKIAYAHLKEFPDYYTRLKKLEEEAKIFWNQENK